MIAHKKEFYGGFALLIGFLIVLVIFFSPIFEGKNGLDYLDNLYNSISKGSAYYIDKVKEETDAFVGSAVRVALTMETGKQAEQTAPLLSGGGAEVAVSGEQVTVAGDLGNILGNGLQDSKDMYFNEGKKVSEKYGYDERRVLYNWWKALNAMEKELKNQKRFKEAKAVALVVKKAVETSYNYYTITPQKITDQVGIVIFSLIFYVVYTLWYGFAIMFMFEGWGMRLEH